MTTKKNFSVNPNQSSSESLLKDIRRNTKRIFTSEQKVLIVMEGIRGEHSIAELCRKYGISDSTYYKWNKDFIEAGKARLDGDTIREATSDEVKEPRQENSRLKEALYVVKQKCTTLPPIKFGVLVRIINKKVYLHNDNKKEFSSKFSAWFFRILIKGYSS